MNRIAADVSDNVHINALTPADKHPEIQAALDEVQKGCRVRLMTPELLKERINECEEVLKVMNSSHWDLTIITVSADAGNEIGYYGTYKDTVPANTHVTLQYNYVDNYDSHWKVIEVCRNTDWHRNRIEIRLGVKDLTSNAMMLNNILERLHIYQPHLQGLISMLSRADGELLYEQKENGHVYAHVEPIDRDYELSYKPYINPHVKHLVDKE